MADTVCDPNSFRPSFSQMLGKEVGSSLSAPESDLYTPSQVIHQGGKLSPTLVGLLASILAAVDTAHEAHASLDGSTVSLQDGNMLGQPLYAVSIYPERSVELPRPPTRQDFLVFVLRNLDVLLKPHHAFGTWVNKYTQCHVLDVVACVRDRCTALELGQKFHQLAVFDLANLTEIAIDNYHAQPESSAPVNMQRKEVIAQ